MPKRCSAIAPSAEFWTTRSPSEPLCWSAPVDPTWRLQSPPTANPVRAWRRNWKPSFKLKPVQKSSRYLCRACSPRPRRPARRPCGKPWSRKRSAWVSAPIRCCRDVPWNIGPATTSCPTTCAAGATACSVCSSKAERHCRWPEPAPQSTGNTVGVTDQARPCGGPRACEATVDPMPQPKRRRSAALSTAATRSPGCPAPLARPSQCCYP